jgi:hypothetical protein
VPDSQVTSLHYHFPWLVAANLRWSIFCAATKRPMRRTLDWGPYYDVLAQDLPYRERIAAYGAIARHASTPTPSTISAPPTSSSRRGGVEFFAYTGRQGRRCAEGGSAVPGP